MSRHGLPGATRQVSNTLAVHECLTRRFVSQTTRRVLQRNRRAAGSDGQSSHCELHPGQSAGRSSWYVFLSSDVALFSFGSELTVQFIICGVASCPVGGVIVVLLLSGGYTVGPKPLIDLLRQRSRPYLFSNSLPPPVVGCATRAVELLLASNEIAQSMTAKTMRWVCCCRLVEVWFHAPLLSSDLPPSCPGSGAG